MIEFLRPLFRHQEWADGELLNAIKACPAAVQDERLRAALFHIVVVQRYYLAQCTAGDFDLAKELKAPEVWSGLEDLFHTTHAAEHAFIASVSPAELERVLELPHLKGLRLTVAQAMTQVVMHSQHHRGQCAMRLRDLGGVPPTLDYILWLRDGPPLAASD